VVSQAVSSVLSSSSCIGFSGSRSPSAASLSALGWACGQVPHSAAVVVGCARGVDQAVRAAFPKAQVFQASQFGSDRGAFAARSVACVQAVAASSGLWVSFPSTACPMGLLPSPRSSKCFSGMGSGTWASLAFAVGSGVPCLLYLPAGVQAPTAWDLEPLGGGWYRFTPAEVQASLF
jgi:hypothetical protein